MGTAITTKPKPGRSRHRVVVAKGRRQSRPASVDASALLLRQLAYTASNDLLNAITPVGLSTAWLRSRLKRAIRRDPEIGEALADIDRGAQRVERYVEWLVACAAPE